MEIQIPAPVAAAEPVVRLLTEADFDRWDTYVFAHPQATFFHRAGWKRVIEEAFGHRTHFLYAEQGGAITGILPLAEIDSRLFGHSLASLPFCAYGGVVSDNDAVARVLDDTARELAYSLDVDVLEYRSLEARHPDWKLKDLYVTFRKKLEPEVEQNMNAIPRKQRAMVRKGIKAGLVSEPDAGVERFYRVFANNVHRQGTPTMPRRYFEILREVFGPDCSVLSVVKNGAAVSSVLELPLSQRNSALLRG